jgi:hypothetical protein
MARTDWVAINTEPAAEYTAWLELTRLGLAAYLPQARRRWRPAHSTVALLRKYPVFPRYVLLPYPQAHLPAVRLCRGVLRARPILCNGEGHLWRAPGSVIDDIRAREAAGAFDEVVAVGDKVQVAKGALRVEAVLTEIGDGRLSVLLPLFGGVKATVPQADVARA